MNTTRFLGVLALCLLTATTLCAQRGGGDDGDRGGGFGGRGGGPPGGGFGGRGGGPPGGGFGGGPPGGGFGGRGGGPPGGGFGGRGGGGDPSSFLSRLDANGNGIIDPDEQQGPAQFIISRLQQSDPSIRPGQPIPLSKITEGFERMRGGGDRGSDRGDDTRQAADDALMPELLVPGFGLEGDAEPNLLMGFGAAAEMLSVPVTPDDERQAGETLRRYDRNRDGFLTQDELSSRFSGNPMDFDRNRDGKLSQSELSVRYARRREGEEQARDSRDRDRGRERTREEKVEIPDVFNGRRSYRPTASRKLPEGLPGFFTDKDTNNDGQVTMAEFASEWNESVLNEFFDSDFNRDGVITADEALRSVEEGGALKMASTSSPPPSDSSTSASGSSVTTSGAPDEKYVKVAQRIVERYDANKDQALTASEWGKMLMSPADADADRDGKITVDEYAMWMQSRQKK